MIISYDRDGFHRTKFTTMLFLYAPTCYRRGEKQKNICMFITFKRMDGFFETAHLKRTSVYYKRRKEKCIKKQKKYPLSPPSKCLFPDSLISFTWRNFLIYCYLWKGSKVSSFDEFEDSSLVEYIFLLITPFLFFLPHSFFLSLSLLHFERRLIFSLYLWAIWTLLHNGKQRVVIFIA